MIGTPGVYILIVYLAGSQTIKVGKKRVIPFEPGYYFYVGSALGGLENRIKRHLAREKKHHWHIDYLLDTGKIIGVLAIPTTHKIECQVANSLSEGLESIVGFGSSDCNCRSHLFYYPKSDWGAFLSLKLTKFRDGEVIAQIPTYMTPQAHTLVIHPGPLQQLVEALSGVAHLEPAVYYSILRPKHHCIFLLMGVNTDNQVSLRDLFQFARSDILHLVVPPTPGFIRLLPIVVRSHQH